MKKIAICSDHAGFELKEKLKAAYPDIEWMDVGTDSTEQCDYPDYAFTLAMAVAGNYAPMGIAICGTGAGMAMALNRHPYIRAAVVMDADVAKTVREHNDANVLCLGARLIEIDTAKGIVDAFTTTNFAADVERYVRRNRKLSLQDDEGDCCDHDHGDGHDHHGHDHGPDKGGCCGGGCH